MAKPKLNAEDKTSRDNRSRQLNPNNDAYWQSRGHEHRLPEWQPVSASPPPPPITKRRKRG